MLKLWLFAAIGSVIVLSTSCKQSPAGPAAVCASADTQNGAFSLIFDSAESAASALGANPGVDMSAVRNQLEQMRRQSLLSFSFSTLEGVDKTTGKISCSGKIKISLGSQDQTKPAQDALTLAISGASDLGLSPPAGLPSGSATSMVDFTEQPAASGGQVVYGVDNQKEVVSAVLLLAISRVAVQQSVDARRSTVSTTANNETDQGGPSTEASNVSASPPTPSEPDQAQANPGGTGAVASSPKFYPTSFDCSKAQGYASVTICTDPELAAYDIELSRLYAAALARDSTGQIRGVARSALYARQACQDRECLVQWYKERMDAYE
jgi:uncharacterized protein YecT (DUF1311 family)